MHIEHNISNVHSIACRKLMYHTPFHTNYTALTESGADWVVKHHINFVGIDYLSIATYEELAPAHQSLMRVVNASTALVTLQYALALQTWIGAVSEDTRTASITACVLHLLLCGYFLHTSCLHCEFCSTYLISFILNVHTCHGISMHARLWPYWSGFFSNSTAVLAHCTGSHLAWKHAPSYALDTLLHLRCIESFA